MAKKRRGSVGKRKGPRKKAAAGSVRVYKYGAPVSKTRPITGDGAASVSDQMLLQHRYRNDLAAQEHKRRNWLHRVFMRYSPPYVQLYQDLSAANDAVVVAEEVLKTAQAAARKRVRPQPLVQAVKDAKAHRDALDNSMRILKKALYGKKAPADQQPKVGAVVWLVPPSNLLAGEGVAKIERWNGDEKRRLRAEYAKVGLYWGTYLVSEDAMKKAGEGPPPNFKRWRGDGHMGLQLNRNGGLTTVEAFAGTSNWLRIDPVPTEAWEPGGRGLQYTRVWIRVGSDSKKNPVWAVVPLYLHRPLPDDATIKWVHLLRNRVGTHDTFEVHFVLSRTSGWAKQDCAERGTVGVDVGWRVREDGLRVAYWIGDDGVENELVLPQEIVDGFKVVRDLRSIRDKNFDVMRATVSAWIKGLGLKVPDWLKEATAHIHAWKSPAKLARLARQWRASRFAADAVPLPNAADLRATLLLDAPQGPIRRGNFVGYGNPESIYELLQAWSQRDRHLYDWERFQERSCANKRMDLYRKFAVELRRSYRTIAIEALDLSKFHRIPSCEDPDDSPAARINTRTACLSTLLNAFKTSANLVPLDPAFTTMDCFHCGHREDFDRLDLDHECGSTTGTGGCGAVWDQDRNAALNLLRNGGGGVAPQCGCGCGVGGGKKSPKKKKPTKKKPAKDAVKKADVAKVEKKADGREGRNGVVRPQEATRVASRKSERRVEVV